jgi:hypothetical protein
MATYCKGLINWLISNDEALAIGCYSPLHFISHVQEHAILLGSDMGYSYKIIDMDARRAALKPKKP